MGKFPDASSLNVPFEDDFLKVEKQLIMLLSPAFMQACPEHESGSCRLGRHLKCTADCGAIKDFFYYLEISK